MSNRVVRSKGRTYGGLSPEERKRQRKQQFLKAAFEVFGNEGYRTATVRRICSEAKLTDRYFYQCFGDMESLLFAIYEDTMTRLKEQTLSAMQESVKSLPIREIIYRGLDAFFTALKDPRVARISMLEMEGVSPEAEKLYNSYILEFAHIFIDVARQSSSAWANLHEQEQEVMGLAMVGAVRQTANHWVLNQFDIEKKVLVQATSKVLIGLMELVDREH